MKYRARDIYCVPVLCTRFDVAVRKALLVNPTQAAQQLRSVKLGLCLAQPCCGLDSSVLACFIGHQLHMTASGGVTKEEGK